MDVMGVNGYNLDGSVTNYEDLMLGDKWTSC